MSAMANTLYASLPKGETILLEGRHYHVLDFDHARERVVLVSGSETRTEARDWVLAKLAIQSAGMDGVPVEVFGATLPDHWDDRTRAQASARLAALAYVFSNLQLTTFASWLPDQVPATAEGRIDALVARVEVLKAREQLPAGLKTLSRPTLYAWRDSYRELGNDGLVHKSKRGEAKLPSRGLHPEFVAGIDALVADRPYSTTTSVAAMVRKVRGDCVERGIPLSELGSKRRQDDYTSYKVELADGNEKSAKKRNSDSLKPVRGYRGDTSSSAGQKIELDQHVLDVIVHVPARKKPVVRRYVLVTAIDSYSSCCVALRLLKASASSDAAGLLVWDVVRNAPLLEHDLTGRDLIWSGLRPDQLAFIDTEEHPWGPAGSVTLDRGNEFVNGYLIGILGAAGIDIGLAPPRTPTYKPHVEPCLKAVEAGMQDLPGYVGSTPIQRGIRVQFDSDVPLAPSVFERMARRAMYIHNHIPSRLIPGGGKWSPAERFYGNIGERRVERLRKVEPLVPLLPCRYRSISNDGIRWKNLFYSCEELNEYFPRKVKNVPMYRDRRDISRIFVTLPERRGYLQVPVRDFSHEGGFGEDLLDAINKKHAQEKQYLSNYALSVYLEDALVRAMREPITSVPQLIDRDGVATAARDLHTVPTPGLVVGTPLPSRFDTEPPPIQLPAEPTTSPWDAYGISDDIEEY